ncbi:MAG: hypothetical protein ACRDUV_19320 [Pseudonocardiaceae bacterium]
MTTTSPDVTAQLDQLAAATTDARQQLARLAVEHGGPLRDCPTPRWLIPHTAPLAAAITSGTARCCPHLGPTPSVAHGAVSDPGHLTCPRCIRRLAPNPGEDTTCDRPAPRRPHLPRRDRTRTDPARIRRTRTENALKTERDTGRE